MALTAVRLGSVLQVAAPNVGKFAPVDDTSLAQLAKMAVAVGDANAFPPKLATAANTTANNPDFNIDPTP